MNISVARLIKLKQVIALLPLSKSASNAFASPRMFPHLSQCQRRRPPVGTPSEATSNPATRLPRPASGSPADASVWCSFRLRAMSPIAFAPASAADPAFPNALLTPYSLVVLPEIDRVVSTNSSMHLSAMFSGVTYQIWRLSDLKLLKPAYLDVGENRYATSARKSHAWVRMDQSLCRR